MQTMGFVDETSEAFWADPHPFLSEVRERHPLARTPIALYDVLRYDDVQRLLKDPYLTQVGLELITSQGIVSGPLYDWWQLIMFNNDPPIHTRLRSLVGRAFTPRRVRDFRDRIRMVAENLLDQCMAKSGGEFDFVDDFAHFLPSTVLCEMLGIPAEDHARFAHWTALISQSFSPALQPETIVAIEDALVGLNQYVGELIEERHQRPGEDLLTALVQAEDGGDRLDHDELVAMVINLLFAGHDTTKTGLSIALMVLGNHHDDLAAIRSRPELLPGAIEETLRYEPLIGLTTRRASVDIEIAGVPIPQDSVLVLSVMAANRDPRRFVEPDRFDINRPDNHHLTFGYGAHHCIGSSLARAELQESLSVVFERCSRVELLDPHPAWVPFASARRFEHLPIAVSVD
jgi:cytochrome P450